MSVYTFEMRKQKRFFMLCYESIANPIRHHWINIILSNRMSHPTHECPLNFWTIPNWCMLWRGIVSVMTLSILFLECQRTCSARWQSNGLKRSTSDCRCATVVQCLERCVYDQSKYISLSASRLCIGQHKMNHRNLHHVERMFSARECHFILTEVNHFFTSTFFFFYSFISRSLFPPIFRNYFIRLPHSIHRRR